jgi:hypothetical protein
MSKCFSANFRTGAEMTPDGMVSIAYHITGNEHCTDTGTDTDTELTLH